jgi:hypothetical protein
MNGRDRPPAGVGQCGGDDAFIIGAGSVSDVHFGWQIFGWFGIVAFDFHRGITNWHGNGFGRQIVEGGAEEHAGPQSIRTRQGRQIGALIFAACRARVPAVFGLHVNDEFDGVLNGKFLAFEHHRRRGENEDVIAALLWCVGQLKANVLLAIFARDFDLAEFVFDVKHFTVGKMDDCRDRLLRVGDLVFERMAELVNDREIPASLDGRFVRNQHVVMGERIRSPNEKRQEAHGNGPHGSTSWSWHELNRSARKSGHFFVDTE